MELCFTCGNLFTVDPDGPSTTCAVCLRNFLQPARSLHRPGMVRDGLPPAQPQPEPLMDESRRRHLAAMTATPVVCGCEIYETCEKCKGTSRDLTGPLPSRPAQSMTVASARRGS